MLSTRMAKPSPRDLSDHLFDHRAASPAATRNADRHDPGDLDVQRLPCAWEERAGGVDDDDQ